MASEGGCNLFGTGFPSANHFKGLVRARTLVKSKYAVVTIRGKKEEIKK